jgi:hypothetical protein
MSVLDELKKEAEKLQHEKEGEQEKSARLEKLYEAKFRNRMVGIARYLHQLVNQVKAAKLEAPVDYVIPEIGPVSVKQKAYVVSADSMDKPHRIGLQVDCIADTQGEWEISPIDKANKVGEFFDEKGVQYTEWSTRNAARKVTGRTFQAQLKIRVWFIVEADVKREKIHVKVVNYDFDGERHIYFKPGEIDKEWLNKFAKFILRKDTEFGSLEIEDADVSLIKTQMEEAEMERQLEIELAERKKEGVLGKLFDTLNKPIF